MAAQDLRSEFKVCMKMLLGTQTGKWWVLFSPLLTYNYRISLGIRRRQISLGIRRSQGLRNILWAFWKNYSMCCIYYNIKKTWKKYGKFDSKIGIPKLYINAFSWYYFNLFSLSITGVTLSLQHVSRSTCPRMLGLR